MDNLGYIEVETPVLQPNDTLTVPENCKNCIVGIITATDPDKDPIKYTVKEPGFTIDSAGVLKLTEPLDYEKTPVVTITDITTKPEDINIVLQGRDSSKTISVDNFW